MKNKISALLLKIKPENGDKTKDYALTGKEGSYNEFIFLHKCERCGNYTEDIIPTNDIIRINLCNFCMNSYKEWKNKELLK